MKKVIMLTMTLFMGYANAQTWNQSGDNYSTGKLGIGFSAAPYYDLDISKTTPYLRIHTSSYSNNPAVLTRKGGIIFNQENNDKTTAVLFAVPPGYHVPGILFATKTAWNVPSSSPTDWYDRMFIHPNGNVGIGTVDPGAFKLHTAENIRMGGQATVGRSGSHYDEFTYNVGFTTTNDQYTYVGTDAAASIRMGYQGSIEFRTAPSGSAGSALALTNRMNIKQDGKVGIGTTTPYGLLEVKGSSASNSQLIINSTSEDAELQFGYNNVTKGYVWYNPTDDFIAFGRGSEENSLHVSNAGLLGIGTKAPSAKLHIAGGNVLVDGVLQFKNANYTVDISKFQTGIYPNNTGFLFKTEQGGPNGSSVKIDAMAITHTGDVGIGTTNPDAKLAVNGTIHTKEVKVDMNNWSDYVFDKDYKLRSLSDVQQYIDENHHLPDVPSEKEVLANGQNLGEMNAILLKKIEELTLYVIELKKENEQDKIERLFLKRELEEMKNQKR